MSFYDLTTKEYLAEMSKILPDWTIEISPKDYIDSSVNYGKVTLVVTVRNKQYSKIIKQVTHNTIITRDVYGNAVPLKSSTAVGRVNSLVAFAISIISGNGKVEDREVDETLNYKFNSHFSDIWEKRKIIELNNNNE